MANPYFNATYYLANNPDLFAAGINTVEGAWAHYVQFGAAEALQGAASRSPAPWFDIAYYLKSNSDLATAGLTAGQLFEHFINFGIEEGRQPSVDANVNSASLAAYAAANADLREAFGIEEGAELTPAQELALAQHFYAFGYAEPREGKPAEYEPEDPNTGETFTLTTGIDNFTGTAGNDTFIAGAVGTTSTLNPGDQIDGGAGTDTLKMYDAANAAAFGSAVIKNVEIVENYATSDLNVSANAGVQQVWQMGNTGATTTTTASLAQTVGLSGAFSDDATVTFNNATGANDSATIAVKDAAVAATKSVFVAGIENLTVQAAGKNALTTLNANAAKSLTITGEGSVSATVAGTTTLAKIDASGNTGGVTLSVANTAVAAAGIAITGGTGNDSISLTGTAVKSTVDLGAGDDTLSISAVPTAGSTLNGGEGTDTLVLNGVTMTAAAGKMFTNFEHLKLGTGTSVYAVGDIAGIASYEIGAGTSATLNKLASGTDILVSGDNAVTLNIATPVAANASIDVSLNNAAKAAANGVVVSSLTTTAHTVNIESAGLVNTTHNKVVLADTAAVTDVHITGSQAFDFSVAGNTNNTVAIINGSAATGALALDASNANGGANGVFVTGGSANDVITAAAGVANTIKGGLGADLIKLGTGADTVVLTSQADSTATAFDAVTGFTAGADKIDISAFNITSSLQKVGVSNKATVDINTTAGSEITSTFTITDANAAGFFTTGGVQNGVMIVVDSADATEGAFAFIDVDGDGNWNAATDAVIALVGADYSTITDTSFVFA